MPGSKTKPHIPTPDELMRISEQRGIRSAVAMYTVKDLVCAGKVKIDDLKDFYEKVDETYEALREISAGEASPNQKDHLVNILRTSTFDLEVAEQMGREIMSPYFTWKQFNEMRHTIMSNQRDNINEGGVGNQGDIHKKMNAQEGLEHTPQRNKSKGK